LSSADNDEPHNLLINVIKYASVLCWRRSRCRCINLTETPGRPILFGVICHFLGNPLLSKLDLLINLAKNGGIVGKLLFQTRE
jgi:hypothetical protein